MKYVALLLLAGCATTGNNHAFDRCSTGTVMEACNPADYPPMTEMLPKPPGPTLLVPIEEAEAMSQPPPVLTPEEEAAKRLLEKLGK